MEKIIKVAVLLLMCSFSIHARSTAGWKDFAHIKEGSQQLFLNMKALLGSYTVTIRNADEAEVYRKNVQTSSLMAINADLSKLPQGIYTLNIENSEEAYTATLQLHLDANAIHEVPDALNAKPSTLNYYDLSGRCLSTPPAKGIYIRDGKKVVR